MYCSHWKIMIGCLRNTDWLIALNVQHDTQEEEARTTNINKEPEEKKPWCCRKMISYWPCSFHSVCDYWTRIVLWTHTHDMRKINIYLSIYAEWGVKILRNHKKKLKSTFNSVWGTAWFPKAPATFAQARIYSTCSLDTHSHGWYHCPC